MLWIEAKLLMREEISVSNEWNLLFYNLHVPAIEAIESWLETQVHIAVSRVTN